MIWSQCLIDCTSPASLDLFIRQFGACLARDEDTGEFLMVEAHYILRGRRGFLDALVGTLQRKGFAHFAGIYPDAVTISDPEGEIDGSPEAEGEN